MIARFQTGFSPALVDTGASLAVEKFARFRCPGEAAGQPYCRARHEFPSRTELNMFARIRVCDDFWQWEESQVDLLRASNWMTHGKENGGPGMDVIGVVVWHMDTKLRLVRDSLNEPGQETLLVGPPLVPGQWHTIEVHLWQGRAGLLVDGFHGTTTRPWSYGRGITDVRAGAVYSKAPLYVDVDDFGWTK